MFWKPQQPQCSVFSQSDSSIVLWFCFCNSYNPSLKRATADFTPRQRLSELQHHSDHGHCRKFKLLIIGLDSLATSSRRLKNLIVCDNILCSSWLFLYACLYHPQISLDMTDNWQVHQCGSSKAIETLKVGEKSDNRVQGSAEMPQNATLATFMNCVNFIQFLFVNRLT